MGVGSLWSRVRIWSLTSLAGLHAPLLLHPDHLIPHDLTPVGAILIGLYHRHLRIPNRVNSSQVSSQGINITCSSRVKSVQVKYHRHLLTPKEKCKSSQVK